VSAHIVRQIHGDGADLRPHQDISQQVGLAWWDEVLGQGCGELEVSTPVVGTDGSGMGCNGVLGCGQAWGVPGRDWAGTIRSVSALTVPVFAQVHILENINPKSN